MDIIEMPKYEPGVFGEDFGMTTGKRILKDIVPARAWVVFKVSRIKFFD